MGRWDPKYTPEQRSAIVHAIVDDGMSAEQACKAAQAGKLEPLEPFEFAVGTARDYANKEKRRRRGLEWRGKANGTPEQRLDAIAERCIAIIEANLNRVDKRNVTPADAELGRKLIGWARETRALIRSLPPTQGNTGRRAAQAAQSRPTNPPNGTGTEDRSSALVRELLKEIEDGSGPRSRTRSANPGAGAVGAAAELEQAAQPS